MSGVSFLVKTFTPSGRRRRRCEKQQHRLELPGYGQCQPDVVPYWDTAAPITPPAMFLPSGYKRAHFGKSGKNRRKFTLFRLAEKLKRKVCSESR